MKGVLTAGTRPLLVAIVVVVLAVVAVLAYVLGSRSPQSAWTEQEIAVLSSLSVDQLQAPPPDPSNSFADDQRAAKFGQKVFFDTRFSSNSQVACATCHQEERSYTDGQQFSTGVGTTGRSAPSVLGAAYSRFLFWDGRKDSLWAQALGPLESPVEHGAARTLYAKIIAQHYAAEYEEIFGPLPADFSDDTRFPAIAGPVPIRQHSRPGKQ